MSHASVQTRTRHFWINIAPPKGVDAPTKHGTLICEDNDEEIRREAIDFITMNSNEFEMDWRIDILRPAGAPPICSGASVMQFVTAMP